MTSPTSNYGYINVGKATNASLVALENNTEVYVSGNLVATLNSQQRYLLSSPSSVFAVRCNFPVAISGRTANGNNVPFVPEYLASNTIACTVSRFTGVTFFIYSLEATSIEIFKNGVSVLTQAIDRYVPFEYTTSSNINGKWVVVGNGKILGYKQNSTGAGDGCPMLAPALDLVGFCSSLLLIANVQGSITSTIYGNIQNTTITSSNTSVNVPNNSLGLQSTNNRRYYNRLSSVRIRPTSNPGISLFGNSRGDGDGGDDTPLLPVSLMRTKHIIPIPTEFVSIVSLTNDLITVTPPFGAAFNITPIRNNNDPLAPYATRTGSTNGTAPILVGTIFSSTSPFMLVYQPKGSGGFGGDDDETISFGTND